MQDEPVPQVMENLATGDESRPGLLSEDDLAIIAGATGQVPRLPWSASY
jgi:hypothetical protein